MAREETLAWAKSLKPGDVVIHKGWNECYTLTVEKVTPTGIIKTNGGMSFAQTSFSDRLLGRGRTGGEIVPATEELLAEAEKQRLVREENRRKAETLQKAWYKMRYISSITYEFAADFLELCEKHGIK